MNLVQKLTQLKDKRRNKEKTQLIGLFLDDCKKIVDIGTGSGGLARSLIQKGYVVTPVDVINKTTYTEIKPLIYNGTKLPFPDKTFDASLLITVLHHCKNPEQVFEEALRVSSKKMIILEDVYSNCLMKHLTWFMDSLLNMEFKGHPHSNKSEEEWEALFATHNLKIVKKTKTKILIFFTQVMFHLEK